MVIAVAQAVAWLGWGGGGAVGGAVGGSVGGAGAVGRGLGLKRGALLRRQPHFLPPLIAC